MNPSSSKSFSDDFQSEFGNYLFIRLKSDPKRAVGLASIESDTTIGDLKHHICRELDVSADRFQLTDLTGNPLASDLTVMNMRLPENTIQIVCATCASAPSFDLTQLQHASDSEGDDDDETFHTSAAAPNDQCVPRRVVLQQTVPDSSSNHLQDSSGSVPISTPIPSSSPTTSSTPTSSTSQFNYSLTSHPLQPTSSPASQSQQPSFLGHPPTLAGSFFDVRCFKPNATSSGSSGLLCEFTWLLMQRDFATIRDTCLQIPLNCLLSSIPFLCAIDHPIIVEFLAKAASESPQFATRLWCFANQRPAFPHLAAIVVALPTPECFKLFDGTTTFSKGLEIVLPVFHHPFSAEPLRKVKVDHIFSSLARPMIISFPELSATGSSLSVVASEAGCRLLVKRNEDIYHESAIQLLFKCINELWADKLPPCMRPFICSFREVPCSPTLGFLQIVEGCKDLEEIERGDFALIDDECREHFVRTSCGWVLAAYVLGLSDRHRENTLVRLVDGSAIPIDFGFMLGNRPPSVNTYMVTISQQMYSYLLRHNAWASFAVMFISGFMVLRAFSKVLLALAAHLFHGHRDVAFVRRFIANRLLLQEADEMKVLRRIADRLRHAPLCSDTKRKIDGHRKDKQFLAKHGGNLVVRFVVQRAIDAAPTMEPAGSHHRQVPLQIPKLSLFPPSTPPKLLAYFQVLIELLGNEQQSHGKDGTISPSKSTLFRKVKSGFFFSEKMTSHLPPDPEAVPQFLLPR